MQVHELNAEPRSELGKSPSRRLRRSGRIPGTVYGTAKEPQSISLRHDDVLHRLDHESFYSTVLTLNVDSQGEQVVVKDVQRHPCKPDILHIDFLRIDEKQRITMRVPLHFLNEQQCVGVKTGGGVISRIMTELEVSCLPKDLPEYIEVDLANVQVGESIHLSDIGLPEGVEIHALLSGGDASASVATVSLPKGTLEEEELEEGLEEGLEETETESEAEAESESEAE